MNAAVKMIGAPVLPHSVEVEQALIGAVLADPTLLDNAAALVEPDRFYDPLHQRLWGKITAEHASGRKVSPLTMRAAMRNDPGLAEIGDGYVINLARTAPPVSNVTEFCRIICDFALRRDLIAEGDRIAGDAASDADGGETLANHLAAMHALAEGRTAADDPRSWYEAGKSVIAAVAARSAGQPSQLLPSGIAPVDARLGGYERGELVILAGRPGMGKTAVGLFIAHAVARRGLGVYFNSLEMRDEALLQRGLAMRARERGIRIPYDVIRRGKMHDFQQDELASVLVEDANLPLVIDQRRGMTVAQIGARMRRQQARFRREGRPLGLGVIDHLGLIESSGQYRGNRVAEITEITKGLKNLAGSLGIPVLALCQLNRQVESRDDKRPMLADLRDSGSIEQDADIVIFAHREEYYLRKNPPKEDAKETERGKWQVALARAENKLDLIVAKNRMGAEAQVTVQCEIGCNWIGGEV